MTQLQRAVESLPDNLNLKYYLGVALLEEGFYPQAIEEFRKAYPVYVESKEMNYNLALACYQAGDLDSSLLYLQQAEDSGALQDPEIFRVADLYFNIGLKHLERSSFQDAEREFLRALELEEGRLQIHRSLGDLYNRMGDSTRALAEFEQYYRSFPEDGEVRQFLYASYLNKGVALLNGGETSQARILFDQAMTMDVDHSMAAYLKGYLDYLDGNYSLAARSIKEVQPLLAEDLRYSAAAILYNCALELSKNDASLQEALDVLDPLLAGPHPSARDLFLAGTILMKQEKHEEALGLFERVLQLEPSHQGALLSLVPARNKALEQLIGLAGMALTENRISDAQRALESALRIDPSDSRARMLEAKVLQAREQLTSGLLADSEDLLARGDTRLALDKARQARSMYPELEEGIHLEEKILAALGQEITAGLSSGQEHLAARDLARATEAFETVLALDPENVEALNGLTQISAISRERARQKIEQGRAALGRGEPAVAASLFKEALVILPDSAEAKEGSEAAQAGIEEAINQRVVAAREALGKENYVEALRQLKLARDLRESPLLHREAEAARKALANRVSELLGNADQAFAENDLIRSAGLCRKALEIDPGNDDAKARQEIVGRAIATAVATNLQQAGEAMAEGKINRALASYKKVLDLDSANAQALQGLSDWKKKEGPYLANLEAQSAEALSRGDYGRAEKILKEVLALSPGRTEAREGLKKLGKLRGEGIKPGDEDRLYLEGIDLYTQGRYEEAVALWKKVQLLNPDHAKAQLNIDKALRKLQTIREKRNG